MVMLRQPPDGTIEVDACSSVAFDPQLELESSGFAAELKAALKEFCGSARDVSIWAAPKLDRARLHHLQIPRVNPSRLPGAVYWALQREEPFLEKETVVDFAIEEGAEPAAGINIDITGALAMREDVEGLQKAFSLAGFPLSGIALPMFALRSLVNLRQSETPEAPALICQMGMHATSVSVLLERRLVFTRNIPLGLRNLTDTLVKSLDPTPNPFQAGKLVIDLGRDADEASEDERWPREAVFRVLRPVLDRMARQIERTIQYYQTNYNTEPIETIYLGGEIAARGRLAEFIAEQLPANVIALDPFDAPELKTNASMPEDPAARIAYGPAFGLALAGKGSALNLARTYSDRAKEQKRRRLATAVSAFLILLTAIAAGFYAWQQKQLHGLRDERDGLNRSLSAFTPRLSEPVILAAMSDVRALQERRRAATKRYEGLAVLSEITRLTPPNISLLSVAAEMGSPIKSAPESDRALALEGVVDGDRTALETTLTIYVARLNQSPLFDTVEVESTKLVDSPDGLRLVFTVKVKSESEAKGAIAKK